MRNQIHIQPKRNEQRRTSETGKCIYQRSMYACGFGLLKSSFNVNGNYFE